MINDIESGKGLVSKARFSKEKTKEQAVEMLRGIHRVLLEVKKGNYSNVEVYAPLHGDVDPGSRNTTHAEQNIEHAVYLIAQKLKLNNKDGVIVPMAGKFVACATCNEVEHVSKSMKGGLFNPDNDNQILLHRSTQRVGGAYPDEKQYLADSIISRKKAAEISFNFKRAPTLLSSAGSKMVEEHAFDTASDSD